MANIYALDSRAVLGLLAKAQQMFTSEKTSLAFPIGTPLAFDATQLFDAMGPAPDAVHHALLAEFSTAMNFVPDGIIWSPSGGSGLDDVVREIVGQGEWAEADRTPAEEARLLAAQEQIDLHNPEMAEYSSLEDTWIRNRERLANTPNDPGAQAAERAAHAAVDAHPARARIEHAIGEVLALDERAPHRARDRFKRMITEGTGTFTDPSGGTFSPVLLQPRAVLTSPGWDSVTLDRAALDELAAGAPPELTDHLRPPEGGGDPIRAISFEYASALLQRSWFDDGIFKLRCWRFADGERLLSDGARPGSGECPAYVTAIVLARNVRVTTVAPPPAPDGNPGGGEVTVGSVDFMVPEVLTEILAQPVSIDPVMAVEPTDPEVIHPAVRAPAEGDPVPPEVLADRGAVCLEAARTPDGVLLKSTVYKDAYDEPPAPADPGLVTQGLPEGSVIVLALICKAVPRSPDPDPAAQWP